MRPGSSPGTRTNIMIKPNLFKVFLDSFEDSTVIGIEFYILYTKLLSDNFNTLLSAEVVTEFLNFLQEKNLIIMEPCSDPTDQSKILVRKVPNGNKA